MQRHDYKFLLQFVSFYTHLYAFIRPNSDVYRHNLINFLNNLYQLLDTVSISLRLILISTSCGETNGCALIFVLLIGHLNVIIS